MTTAPAVWSMALVAAMAMAGCAPGQPAPAIGHVCEGVPAGICAQILEDEEANALDPAAGVVGIEIRCSVTSCTEASGEATVKVTYADGRTVTGSQGWASAPAAPVAPLGGAPPTEPTPLPVEPLCVGVDRDQCVPFAAEGLGELQPGNPEPVSVMVRCTTTCDEGEGDGETVVRYVDGSSNTIGWSYRSGE